jgi:4-hydroxy-4-methyl-2-oxoglutarate aldolase
LTVRPGDIVFGDRDGVIVIPQEKAEEVLCRAEALAAKEVEVKAMLRQGKTTIEIYKFEKLQKNNS